MVFPDSDYDTSALTQSGDNLVFSHKALGAEMLRYSLDFGKNWSSWRAWEDNTTIPLSEFKNKEYFWKGNHVLMNCELTLLSGYQVYSNCVRRFQIGQLLRVLLPPLCMPTMGTAPPAEFRVSSPEENSIGSVSTPTFLQR